MNEYDRLKTMIESVIEGPIANTWVVYGMVLEAYHLGAIYEHQYKAMIKALMGG